MLSSQLSTPSLSADLRLPWGIAYATAALLVLTAGLAVRLVDPQVTALFMTDEQRLLLRTVFYWMAILTLPITNLIRHVQLRLNQTMPTATPAKQRYVLTVLVSMALVSSIGLYGVLLFVLGDGMNSLLIFTGMGALGVFLYRPKPAEYQAVCEAVAARNLP